MKGFFHCGPAKGLVSADAYPGVYIHPPTTVLHKKLRAWRLRTLLDMSLHVDTLPSTENLLAPESALQG